MKLSVLVFLSLSLAACDQKPKLTIATSANMAFAITEIAEAFEKEKRIDVDIIVSSSGTLTNQINQGAPFDVFIAANMKYPESLHQNGLTQNLPKIYAYGNLILWTLNDFQPSMEMLLTDSISKIAVTNPRTGPYGEKAVNYLKKMGVYSELKHKLVFGQSVSQTNQFIFTKTTDLGFTSLSTVKSEKNKSKGQWIVVDEDLSLAQGIVQMKNSLNEKSASQFV